MSIPVVKHDEKSIPTLYVHDKPFFMRSGEIHNSNASDPVYLEEKLWPALRGLHLNSVIVPLYSCAVITHNAPCKVLRFPGERIISWSCTSF